MIRRRLSRRRLRALLAFHASGRLTVRQGGVTPVAALPAQHSGEPS